MINGKNIIVGVCGGISVYKVVDVVRKLILKGACVNVVMTENAQKFVTDLTFRSVSCNAVITDMFGKPENWDIKHISLADRAGLILIAPATANIIGKIAAGIADDMLTTTVMTARAPVLFIPAMNSKMYENPIVQNNISVLKQQGYFFMEPETGMLACGVEGKGRMPEPSAIVDEVEKVIKKKNAVIHDMAGINVMVTAGPTREAIDAVRYITNPSSGKMGYAVASAAASRGANVKLISGPVRIPEPDNVNTVHVNTAEQMYNEVRGNYNSCDVMIFAAAVSDYRCINVMDKKMKKNEKNITIELTRTTDIAYEMGHDKGSRIHVGFSAETDDVLDNARIKLKNKKFDLMVANDITMEGAGFEVDTNIVKIIKKDGSILELPKISKYDAAERILDEVLKLVHDK